MSEMTGLHIEYIVYERTKSNPPNYIRLRPTSSKKKRCHVGVGEGVKVVGTLVVSYQRPTYWTEWLASMRMELSGHLHNINAETPHRVQNYSKNPSK